MSELVGSSQLPALPPILAGRITPEVKPRVEQFYFSVAAIFESWVATRVPRRHHGLREIRRHLAPQSGTTRRCGAATEPRRTPAELGQVALFRQPGGFREGDYEEIMNKASCLSLISNAVLVWNTIQIQKIVEEVRGAGHPVKDEDLARVSPLLRAHVIPNGSYDLSMR
jgi:Tn3 transposase DDE domain